MSLVVSLSALAVACSSVSGPPIGDQNSEHDAGPGDPPPPPDAGDDRLTVAECFEDAFVLPSPITLDYDQFQPVVGTHCQGTNHQDIQGVERIVFLGDSVTVGTPPSQTNEYYRSMLADQLASRFGLEAPDDLWKNVNLLDGKPVVQDSGDFSACPKWGARTDDLMEPQIADCFPPEKRNLRTLVVFTMGGNDISNITQAGIDGVPHEEIWETVYEFVQYLRDALAWFREPGQFPNGVFIVYANMFEFTDGTGNTDACPAASLAGFGEEWDDPDALADMVIWANEQFLRAAVDYQADMLFMLEHFCGHGFNHNDPEGPCYRGPETPRWFDDTCIHPNPAGHQVISDMFDQTVAE